jgi:squalene cyclase
MTAMDRRHFLTRTALAGTALPFVPSVVGAFQPSVEITSPLIDQPTQQSIRTGLDFLAARQNEDGSFGGNGYSRNVGIGGLAGMAFMSSGSMPDRGPHGRHVTRCVDYVLTNTNDRGFISTPGGGSHGPMYGHGFATLFLAEVYGTSPVMDVRDKLSAAVKLIVDTQNEEGGWRYQPRRSEADLSVTICQVMALRAAKNAGIYVPTETIDKCIEYVKRSQNPDGGFMYMLSQPGASRFPRSAAGIVALYSAGIYKGDEIEKGLAYVRQFTPQDNKVRDEGHFFYGHYYAVQAMWHAGGEYWNEWYPAIKQTLISRQRDDGAWFNSSGNEYATAMACLILQMPNSHLPIFQK